MIRKIISMRIIAVAALVTLPILGAQPAQARDGREHCREYTKDVSINGRIEQAYGKACRQSDGTWEIVSLDGSEYARDKVQDSMYSDIEKYETRRAKNGTVERIIIVDNYAYDRPHYRKRYKHYDGRYRSKHRYHSASYNSWPFVIHWGNHNRGRYYSHGKKYHKKSYGGYYKHKRYVHGYHKSRH